MEKSRSKSLSLREIALKYKSKEQEPAKSVSAKPPQKTVVQEIIPINIEPSTNIILDPEPAHVSNHHTRLESNQPCDTQNTIASHEVNNQCNTQDTSTTAPLHSNPQGDTQHASETDTSHNLKGAKRRKPRAAQITRNYFEASEEDPDVEIVESENEGNQICKVSMVTSLLKDKGTKRQKRGAKGRGPVKKARKAPGTSSENDGPLNYCHLCFAMFPTKEVLSEHLDSEHVGETPFQCEVRP